MNTIGVIKKIDSLGRITIPMEFRKILNISAEDFLEISTDDRNIIIRKHENSCVFCDSKINIIKFNGHAICPDCIAQLSENILRAL